MSKAYKRKLISVLIISFAIPLTVFFAIKGIQLLIHGAASNATLSFSQNPVTLNSSTSTAVNVVLNTGTVKAGFAAVRFTFDRTKVNLTSEIVPTTTLKKVISMTTMAQANSSGSVTIILGLDPADIANAPSGSFNVAQLSMKAVGTGSSTLAFGTTGLQVVDMTATAFNLTATNSTVNIATPTPTATAIGATPTPTATAQATIVPTPTATGITAVPSIPTGFTATAGNGSVTFHWTANPSSEAVDNYQVYEADQYLNLNIPANQTSYTTTTDHTGAALVNGTTYSFRLSAHNSVGYGGWTNAVTATPTSGATPTPTIAPTATPTIAPTATPTPTPTSAGITVNFTMKFQGITGAGPNKTASVVVMSGTNTVYSNPNINVTSNGSGVYSGTYSLTNAVGTYDVYLKDGAHLRKKFTGVTYTTGVNTKDFTGSPLLAGDFNNDNTITISDIASELANYTALSTPVNSSNAIYDVDGNGIINIVDVSLVLSNYTALTVAGD